MPDPRDEPSAVLLLHTLPDRSSHFDLMLAPDSAAPLLTFRLDADPFLSLPSSAHADRLPEHRRAYLSYEGPLTDNRGSVARVRSGRAVIHASTPDLLRAEIDWGDGPVLLDAAPVEPASDRWILRATPKPRPSAAR